jgi:fructosamine-3-kinase
LVINKLIDESRRSPVEQLVSEYTGHNWKAKEVRDMADFACHPAAILSDGVDSVFAKFSDADNGAEQFEIELAGLRMLSERAGVLIPTSIGIIQVQDGSILVLEAAQAVERGRREWRDIGQTLASPG